MFFGVQLYITERFTPIASLYNELTSNPGQGRFFHPQRRHRLFLRSIQPPWSSVPVIRRPKPNDHSPPFSAEFDTELSYTSAALFAFVEYTEQLTLLILVIIQLDAQDLFYNKFSSCLYMFRARGGQNCIIQSLVSLRLQVAVRCTG